MTTAESTYVATPGHRGAAVLEPGSGAAPGRAPAAWRSRVGSVLWIGVMLAFAGCTTVGPDFVAPEATVPQQWQGRDAAISAPQSAERIRWWEAFGDPVLRGLIETAYENNYDLKIAGLRVLEARAQLGIAVGSLYPQIQQLNGGVTYTAASENAANTAAGDLAFWEYSVGASVGWELDFWGKYRRSIESADANLLSSIAGYDNVLVLLVAQVADTYVAIRAAEEQLRVARENVTIQQRAVRITEARFRGGDVGELDVLQARTQLLGTQATIPPQEIALQQAKNALSTLLGRPPGDLSEILGLQPGVIPDAPQAIAAGAPTDLLRRRPDVRQAELAAATQSAAVGVAEADLYPSFGLSGFLGVIAADGTNSTRTGNSGIGQLINANSVTFIGGPYFSWNVLNYGRIRNNVRVQDARLQQLLENYQSTVLNAVKEVQDGIVGFVRNREQERILAETETSARRSLAIADIGYREGLADFQRVLDAQASLLRAQQQLVTARGNSIGSAIGIYRALGGGWEIRSGKGFVDEATANTMSRRVDWGELLQPQETEPPLKGQGSGWPSPDW
jgi:NodT family efflux transporter outer membrane factor (OMF) lipoprotein